MCRGAGTETQPAPTLLPARRPGRDDDGAKAQRPAGAEFSRADEAAPGRRPSRDPTFRPKRGTPSERPNSARRGQIRPVTCICWLEEARFGQYWPTDGNTDQKTSYVDRGSYMLARRVICRPGECRSRPWTHICRPGHKYAGPRKPSASPEMPM
jgi:hypothetical protein